MTFIKKFIYQYLCPWLWWVFLISFCGTAIIQIHDYTIFVAEKDAEKTTAAIRYERVCKNSVDVYEMRFGSDCSKWETQRNQNQYWEAFVEVARTWQLCDPARGCNSSVYIVVGIVIGVCIMLWGLNKLPHSYINYLEKMNHEEDVAFMQNTSNIGMFNTDWLSTDFLSGKKKKAC